VLPALYVGSSLVCQDRFEPASALDLIERERPNQYLGWPNALARLRDHPTFDATRFAGLSWLVPPTGDAADPSRRHSGMGMTETSGNHTIAPAAEVNRVLPDELRGAFGAAVPYVQHKIVDPDTAEVLPPGTEGEICIRGYSVMVGYAKREREDTFDIDGWFHTGDRGYFRDGYLFFTGRANDMIKTAGSNVSPREVEEVLTELPEIKLGLVLGLPDRQRGEIVAVAVVPHDGATIDPTAVRAHLRAKLSSYKVPRDDAHVVLFDDGDIPFINGAKPDRKVARRLLADRLGRSTDSSPITTPE
jgi:acyl-CoA synthetase (AMP-forming)/AMP-acid ligase II